MKKLILGFLVTIAVAFTMESSAIKTADGLYSYSEKVIMETPVGETHLLAVSKSVDLDVSLFQIAKQKFRVCQDNKIYAILVCKKNTINSDGVRGLHIDPGIIA